VTVNNAVFVMSKQTNTQSRMQLELELTSVRISQFWTGTNKDSCVPCRTVGHQ